jgi:hypothetical protein
MGILTNGLVGIRRPRGRLAAEGSLLQNRASAVAPDGGSSTSRSSKPGERMLGGAQGLLYGVCGASIRRGGELA